MNIDNYLLENGYEGWPKTKPYQFTLGSYRVINFGTDSYDFEIYGITSIRFDDTNYRGRIKSIEHFKEIMTCVKEDYNLTEEEKEYLKSYN